MIEEKQKSFLEELQSLNEPTKRKVLFISTIIIMAVIIYLWLGYFSGIVADSQNQGQQNISDSVSGSSFWQNMKNGIGAIGNAFQGPRQYTIHPSK